MELSSAAPLIGEESAQKGAQHLTGELRVPRTSVAERIRKGEHPLADRHLGQHALDEMSRTVCQLAQGEPRYRRTLVARASEKRLELLADDLVTGSTTVSLWPDRLAEATGPGTPN